MPPFDDPAPTGARANLHTSPAPGGPDEGPIALRLLRLALPVIGLNTLQVLALTVDTAMVGRLPEADDALTGLGFATQVLFLVMVLMMGLTVGTVAFTARAWGAGQKARVCHVIEQSTALTVLLSVLVAVGGTLAAPSILAALGATGRAAELGLTYLRPLLALCVLNYLNILYAAVLRAVGVTRLPFRIQLFAALVNVVVNYALILGHWGLPQLGVLGAAIGTVASHAVGVALMWLVLARGAVPGVRPPLRWPTLDAALAHDLGRVGAPAAVDMLVVNIGFLGIIGMLGRLDPVAVAAHGIGMRVQGLAFVPGMSVSQALGAMVGNALGGRRPDEARRVVWAGLGLCGGIMTSLGLLIVGLEHQIVRLFDVAPGTALYQHTTTWIRVLASVMPLAGTYIALMGTFHGAGLTRVPLRINLLVTTMVQLPASWVLGFLLGWGTLGVWLGLPLGFAAKAGLAAVAWRRGHWLRVGDRA